MEKIPPETGMDRRAACPAAVAEEPVDPRPDLRPKEERADRDK